MFAVVAGLALGCGGDDGGSRADAGGDPDASLPPVDDAGNPLPGWAALPSLPVSLQEHGVAVLGGKLYTVGGFIGLNVASDLHVYDIAGRTWSTAASLPAPLHHCNVAAVNGKLYVVGALEGLSFNPIASVLEYDPAQDMWAAKTALPAGFARGASAVAVIGDLVYIAGGTGDANSVAQFTSYDTVNDVHDTTLPQLPAALNHLVGAAVGGKVYAIGGRDVGIEGTKNTTYEYDPAMNMWTEKATMPTARGGSAAGVVGDRIVVVGGEGNPAAPSGVFPQAEIYDPAMDMWTAAEDMLTPRHGMGAAGVGNTLYVPAGASQQAFGAVSTFEQLTLR